MMRKRPKAYNAIDPGTPELSRKFTVVPKLISPTETTMKIMDGSEIDRMLMHDTITSAEHGTLMTLGKRLHGYGFVGLRSPSYDSPVHADPEMVADKKANVIRGAVRLIKKMDNHRDIGPAKRKALISLVLEERPWGKLRHQIEALKFCIRAMDDIFLGK